VNAGRFLLAVLTVTLSTSQASAQPYDSVGVRAAGMAGAFVAVADDATAAYWNPAGLATGRLFAAVIDHRETHDGPDSTFVGVSVPVVALTYYRLGAFDRQDLGSAVVSTHNAGVSLVQSLTSAMTIGTTLRFVHRRSAAFDADVGVLAAHRALRIGLGARNLRGAFGASRQARAGLAFRADGGLTLALDADLTASRLDNGDRLRRRRSVAAGVERTVGARWAVRAGIRAHTIEEASPAVTLGASTGIWRSLWIDGHAAIADRDGDRGWGIGARMVFGN